MKFYSRNCPKGFYGDNCGRRCPYPNYGQYCSLICDCTEQNCHHANGCPRLGTCINYWWEQMLLICSSMCTYVDEYFKKSKQCISSLVVTQLMTYKIWILFRRQLNNFIISLFYYFDFWNIFHSTVPIRTNLTPE